MTDTDLYPCSTRDGTDYCPECLAAASTPEAAPPLGAASYHSPRTIQIRSSRIEDSERAFADSVVAFAVTCERHEMTVAAMTGVSDGWVAVRIRTDHGRGHTRVPVAEIQDRPVKRGPDGYDHVVEMGEYNFHDCSVCNTPADYFARDPPDPDAVEFPSGAYFCQDCADDR